MRLLLGAVILFTFGESCWADVSAKPPANPYPKGSIPDLSRPLEIDLGYAGYAGVHNESTSLNYWYGIRYAQSPTGKLRWQAPIPPQTTFDHTFTSAATYPNECPQAFAHYNVPEPAWSPDPIGSEDCLFLNVWAPQNATDLPVFVWIHGGGYGVSNARWDIPFLLNHSVEQYVVVAMQYRLGAFGFLAGDEVYSHGVTNAGLHDQYLALQWVQKYISLFGGDPDRVTIGGESAGGGSVMLQAMAYGGAVGDDLYDGIWAASPYLPQQWSYNDPMPVAAFDAFAEAAGCRCDNSTSKSIFDCLVAQNSDILQAADYNATWDWTYGQWSFVPVTDGKFVPERPSEQLHQGKLNGNRALIGNNANEGELFLWQNITTESDFVDWLHYTFPQFTDEQLEAVKDVYAMPTDVPSVSFATDGLNKDATAVFVSAFGVGQQQRAYNVYGETTFVCPAYWLAEGFDRSGRQSHKYQFSIVNSLHGDDLAIYMNLYGPLNYASSSFIDSFIAMLDSFITTGTPNNASFYPPNMPSDVAAVLESWPAFTVNQPWQANLNQTVGTPSVAVDLTDPYSYNITTYVEPGLAPVFNLVNAYEWEGGRGARCEFWKTIGAIVPEK